MPEPLITLERQIAALAEAGILTADEISELFQKCVWAED